MIITAEEYREMGFECDDDVLLDSCLKRAEYALSSLTEGRIDVALAAGGAAEAYVKRAAAYQTSKLVTQEELLSERSSERVAVGDFSYTSGADTEYGAYQEVATELSSQTIHALQAAGCLYSGREVRE